MPTTDELLQGHCRPQKEALNSVDIAGYLAAIPSWSLENGAIVQRFAFKNFHQTMAFVNAAADVMHAEDHHAELIVSYNRCELRFQTHSVNGGRGGLSENDFICAAKISRTAAAQSPV
jgi:4a-hydroxytetrahydrobiopterin dehydratase